MRVLTVATATLLVAGGALLGASPAAAAVTEGPCASDTGVTLVVDFQDIGGETIVRCVEDVQQGTSGLQVLQEAGLSPQGTISEGSSFVCRIDGRPGPNEALPVTGDPNYRESCAKASPQNAFWSYWYADSDGSWTFSNKGASVHEAIIGGYEGWSFSLNKGSSANPAPRVEPTRPAAEASAVTTPTADTTASPPSTPAPDQGDDMPIGTFVGIFFVAAVAVGGGVAWWRRRSL